MSSNGLGEDLRDEIFRHLMSKQGEAIKDLTREIKNLSTELRASVKLLDRELNRKYWSVPLPVVGAVFAIVVALLFGVGFAIELFPNLVRI